MTFLRSYSQKADSLSLYCKEWRIYSLGLFFGGELTINKNGTFKYHDQGCTRQSFTAGKWILADQDLILTSYKKYKNKESSYPKDKPRIDYMSFDKAIFRLKIDTLYRIDGKVKYKFIASKSNR